MIQEQVLNKILQDKDASLISLNGLTADYFSNYTNEFNFILNHYNKYGVIPDQNTLLGVFPSFPITEVKESNNYLIEELFKDYKSHQLADTFNRVRSLLLEGKSEEALAIYSKSSEDIAKTGLALHSVSILKDTSRYKDYVDRTDEFNKYFVSTGFEELDNIIGGWDRQEELATIIARTNMGKSWILLKFAEAAVKAGLNCGLYSGEMSERKVGYRFDTLVSHISNGSLIHGNVNVMNNYSNYIQKLPTMFPGDLKVLTPNMINGPAGVSALKAFIEKEHLDILFIDQHSLLEDDRKAKNPVEKAANISKDLKNLQVMSRIPIISVSQMNRTKNEDESDYIDSTQIAQSDRIGQDSTTIIGLSRDKKDKSLLKLQIVKSRDAEVGKVLSYIVDFNQGNFTYIPETLKDESGDEDRYSKAGVKDE